jgi:CubicO group peptidase (beta-lactamase class C family)
MHFRNGAVAFTYISFVLARLADEGKISLDDKLSKWLPELPHAEEISLRNLANMTSGYADYVYQPQVLDGVNLDPFRQWTPEELIEIGTSAPMQYAPGTNWGYSHTNYVILGRVIEKITGQALDQVMRDYVFGPMGLQNTEGFSTAAIPEPVLHVFSGERRATLGVPADRVLYEDSTFWNPSWTTAEGAIQVTDLADLTRTYEIIGSGELLSPAMHEAMTGDSLTGFGHKAEGCAACDTLDEKRSYGLGVVLLGPWIAQAKNFYGNGASVGYLPSKKAAVGVVTTLRPEAFDAEGNYPNPSVDIFRQITAAVAPQEAVP